MKTVLQAPSVLNSQKATFIYKDGFESAKIDNNFKFDMVNLEITKKHFKLGA